MTSMSLQTQGGNRDIWASLLTSTILPPSQSSDWLLLAFNINSSIIKPKTWCQLYQLYWTLHSNDTPKSESQKEISKKEGTLSSLHFSIRTVKSQNCSRGRTAVVWRGWKHPVSQKKKKKNSKKQPTAAKEFPRQAKSEERENSHWYLQQAA